MNDSPVANLKKYGFSKGTGKILPPHEALELKKLINELFEDESIIDRKSANCPVIVNLPGRNPRIDLLLEKILSHEDVRSVLFQVLGGDYKAWQVNARRSEIGDKGLYLHQDAPGETNLAVLLSDNSAGSGATAFLPKSHKVPRWASRISWYHIRLASPWLKPLKGELGDVGFFFNRTWHARLENNSTQEHDVILIAFYPQGATYTPYELSQDKLKMWDGWELRRLLDSSIGTRLLENGRVQVVSQRSNQINESYAMLLESGEGRDGYGGLTLLYFKLLFLEIVFFPLHLTYRLLKPLIHLGRSK